MPTNLDLDDSLVAKAKQLGHHRSKKDAVNAALKSYVSHLGQLRIIESFGTVEFNPKYDYKAARQRKPR